MQKCIRGLFFCGKKRKDLLDNSSVILTDDTFSYTEKALARHFARSMHYDGGLPLGEGGLRSKTDEGLLTICMQSHCHPEWSAAQSKDLTHSSANCFKSFTWSEIPRQARDDRYGLTAGLISHPADASFPRGEALRLSNVLQSECRPQAFPLGEGDRFSGG